MVRKSDKPSCVLRLIIDLLVIIVVTGFPELIATRQIHAAILASLRQWFI